MTKEKKSYSEKFYPGFTVTCNKCDSTEVRLDNSMGYSDTSGSWGSLDFVCTNCNNQVEIMDAY